jgi:hypothetical protein
MRYLAILIIWILAWWLPQLAGPGYDTHFHLWQSLISFGLLVAVLSLTDEWWRSEFAAVCVLQIMHSIGDFYFDFPAENYNAIQSTLNWLELTILLGAGGITEIIRRAYGRGVDDSHPDRSPDSSTRFAQARRWNE